MTQRRVLCPFYVLIHLPAHTLWTKLNDTFQTDSYPFSPPLPVSFVVYGCFLVQPIPSYHSNLSLISRMFDIVGK